jgi:hypothetical protein
VSEIVTAMNVAPRLVEAVPEFGAALAEHLEDMGGELLPHLLFGDLTRFTVDARRAGRGELVDRILTFLADALAHGDEYVVNLVDVSFIENLGYCEPAMSEFIASMPAALQNSAREQGWTPPDS